MIFELLDGTLAIKEQVRLINSSGKLTFAFNNGDTGGQSTTALSADGQFHLIQIQITSTSSRKLYIDGNLEITDTTSNASGGTAQPVARLGVGVSTATTADIYIDDILWDDGDAQVSAGQAILLLPTADPVSLNSWTGGAGGTSNLWDAVNNEPPVGLAPASETNTSQIKNAASGGNLDYIATTQSYTTGGVGSFDTVNAVMAIGDDCEEVTTSTKAGGYWINSNPAQTAGGQTFDFGNDTATVCGTFPTGWIAHYGPVTTSPSVTLGTQPTVAIRKTTSTTRVTDADFLGIYVDYTPGTAPTCAGTRVMVGVGC